MMQVNLCWETKEALGWKGLRRVPQRWKVSSIDGWPVKVGTKFDDNWKLHQPLRRVTEGFNPVYAWRILVWSEQTIATASL